MIYRNMPTLASLCAMLFIACNSEHGRQGIYAKETQQFNQYLSENFSKSLDKDSCIYVLLSSNGCSGCVKSFLNMLTGPILNQDVRYIVPYRLLAKNNLDDSQLNNHVLVDRQNIVDRLPYHKGNIAVLESANEVLYNVYAIQPYQTDSILKLIIQY